MIEGCALSFMALKYTKTQEPHEHLTRRVAQPQDWLCSKVIHSECCGVETLAHFQRQDLSQKWENRKQRIPPTLLYHHSSLTIRVKEEFFTFLCLSWPQEMSCFKVCLALFCPLILQIRIWQKVYPWVTLKFLLEVLRESETVKLHSDIKKLTCSEPVLMA